MSRDGVIHAFDEETQIIGFVSTVPMVGYYLPFHAVTSISVIPNEDGSSAFTF